MSRNNVTPFWSHWRECTLACHIQLVIVCALYKLSCSLAESEQRYSYSPRYSAICPSSPALLQVLNCGPLYLLIHVHPYGYEIAPSLEIKGKNLRSLLIKIVMFWIANAQTLCPKAVHFCLQHSSPAQATTRFTCNVLTLRDRQLHTAQFK